MASFFKDKNERQGAGTLYTVILVLIGVISYFAFPAVQEFFARLLVGGKGLLYLLGGGVVLTLWFLFLGYRGKSLRYALLILLFTIFCLWLAINFDMVWDSMTSVLGLWPTIIIVLLGAVAVWLVIYLFF